MFLTQKIALAGLLAGSTLILLFCSFQGMRNRYSFGALLVVTLLLLVGGFGLYLSPGFKLTVVSFIVFLFAFISLIKGFQEPEDASPSRVWLITFFNQMTTVKVDTLTFLLDWIPLKVVGKVEIRLEKTDHDFKLTKKIKCKDGLYIEGLISVSMVADDEDDPSDMKDRRLAGQKLRDYQNAGGMQGTKNQLDDMLTTWTQELANENESWWMETQVLQIIDYIFPKVTGLEGHKKIGNNHAYDDTRGLGVKFTKLQPIFKCPDAIIESRNNVAVEKAKREAELNNTIMKNKQIAERVKLYNLDIVDDKGNVIYKHNPNAPRPSLQQIRGEILQEDMEQDGKMSQVINQGGINIVPVPGLGGNPGNQRGNQNQGGTT